MHAFFIIHHDFVVLPCTADDYDRLIGRQGMNRSALSALPAPHRVFELQPGGFQPVDEQLPWIHHRFSGLCRCGCSASCMGPRGHRPTHIRREGRLLRLGLVSGARGRFLTHGVALGSFARLALRFALLAFVALGLLLGFPLCFFGFLLPAKLVLCSFFLVKLPAEDGDLGGTDDGIFVGVGAGTEAEHTLEGCAS